MAELKVLMLGPIHSAEQDGLLVKAQAVRDGKNVFMISSESSIQKIMRTIEDYQPNWAMVFGRSSVSVEKLAEIQRKAKIFIWDADTLDEVRRGAWTMLKGIPTVIAPSMLSTTKFCKGLAPVVVWIPSFYDNEFYKVTKSRKVGEFKSDVVFIGREGISSPEGLKRCNFCKEVSKHYNMAIYGKLPGLASSLVFGSDMANVYAEAKVVIDIKRIGFDYGEFDTSDRLFKALGCGASYLTYEIPRLDILFNPGVHLTTYDDTRDDLIERIGYLLDNEGEREKIASQGKEEVWNKHLLTHRIADYWYLMESC